MAHMITTGLGSRSQYVVLMASISGQAFCRGAPATANGAAFEPHEHACRRGLEALT